MKFNSARDVQNRYGISRSSIYRWVDDPTINFPAPLKIGNRILWRESDLEAFDASMSASAQTQSPSENNKKSGGV